MPATITPNKTEQERKRRVEDHDNGSGRRPPTDKRTGGGGDNDNWNDRPHGRRGPYERLHRYRMGIFFALASDLMFFVAIVSTFFVNQSTGHFDAYNHYVNEWLPTTIPPILWLNTAVLLLSSATIEIARRNMFRETDVMMSGSASANRSHAARSPGSPPPSLWACSFSQANGSPGASSQSSTSSSRPTRAATSST